jgi:hypothetical protein
MVGAGDPVQPTGTENHGWWPPVLSLVLRELIAAPVALLLTPVLMITVALLTPAPWGIPGLLRGPAIVAGVVGWVALPFAVGVGLRRWWRPLLCLATVLGWVGLVADAGQVVIGGYGEHGQGAPPVSVALWPSGLALGVLAALAAAVGVALAPAIVRLDRGIRQGLVMVGLIAGIVPVVVAWGVFLGAGSVADLGLGAVVAAAVLVVVSVFGPYLGGLWVGAWGLSHAGGWVIACLLAPAALAAFWWPAYLHAIPDRIPAGYGELFTPVYALLYAPVAAAGAAIGVTQARRRVGTRS